MKTKKLVENKKNRKYGHLTPEEIENLDQKQTESLLMPRQILFCKEYLTHYNGTKAAIDAGYKKSSAKTTAAKLKHKPLVLHYLELLNRRRLEKLDVTAQQIIEEYARIGFFNIRDIYDEDGKIKDITKLPDNVTAGISKIKEKLLKKGETADVVEREYHFHNKIEALRDLGKHLGIFEKDNQQRQSEVVAYIPDNNREPKLDHEADE